MDIIKASVIASTGGFEMHFGINFNKNQFRSGGKWRENLVPRKAGDSTGVIGGGGVGKKRRKDWKRLVRAVIQKVHKWKQTVESSATKDLMEFQRTEGTGGGTDVIVEHQSRRSAEGKRQTSSVCWKSGGGAGPAGKREVRRRRSKRLWKPGICNMGGRWSQHFHIGG